MIKIALDGMGGDFAPKPVVIGALQALKKYKNLEITIYGDQNEIKKYLTEENERLKIVHTDKFLDMGIKDPISTYRKDKNYSLFLAMQSVKDKINDAVVTAGPTQAVVVAGHLILKRISSMKRVALAPILPSLDGTGKILLDAGANVDLKPEHLIELGIFARIISEKIMKKVNPKVALVNIGSEEGKGREFEIEAYKLLKDASELNFVGNIEPKDVFITDVDILLTDGFTGNILMKSMEGTTYGLGKVLKRELKSSLKSKIGGLLIKGALKKYKAALDSSEIGGALVIGLSKILIKAHGASDDYAIFNAIRQAKEMVENKVIEMVDEILSKKVWN